MDNNEQIIRIIPNRIKTLLLLISLSLVVTFFSVELIWIKQQRVLVPYQVFVSAVGLLAGSFYFILSGLYALITERPVFIINKKGIIDKSFLSGAGLIKWEEIDTINVYTFMGQTIIGIFPSNAKEFFAKKWPVARLSALINMHCGLAPINIPRSLLSVPVDIFISNMQALHSSYNVGYVLVKKINLKHKPGGFKHLVKPVAVIVSVLMIAGFLLSFFSLRSSRFELESYDNNDRLFFSSANMGGYGFYIDKKWRNVANKQINGPVNQEIRNDIFFVSPDATHELWLSIHKNTKIPIGALTQRSKSRILRQLPSHQHIVRSIDERVTIKASEYTLSSVYLQNSQILSIIGIQSADLSVVGYLAYDSKNLSLIRDLAAVLESFNKTNLP